jgi:glutathione synthase/RimK-type ligase-like ATP-grasp enzyme
MILLLGIPTEPPLEMAAAALQRAGGNAHIVNQRDALTQRLDVEVRDGIVRGSLTFDRRRVPLDDITALYVRLADHLVLPEREGLADDHPDAVHIDRLHRTWIELVDVLPGLVVNRLGAMGSNSSKPYQAQLIQRHGFRTPRTLVTTDPARARRFAEAHGKVIYKSVSGIRSVVRTVTDDDLDRLEQVRWCPTQFQAFVPGDDVRVHVVGDAVHATIIRSEAEDYRYARLEQVESELEPYELTAELADRCRSLSRGLGLAFSGIDLRIDGEAVTCFEVNPSPAYSYYEANTSQPISDDLARLLIAADRARPATPPAAGRAYRHRPRRYAPVDPEPVGVD